MTCARAPFSVTAALALAARLAVVVLAAHVTIPLLAPDAFITRVSAYLAATMAGGLIVAACGALALLDAPQPDACRPAGAA